MAIKTLGLFLVSMSVISGSLAGLAHADDSAKPCAAYSRSELLEAAAGFSCLTSKGSAFAVTARDAASGKQIWVDRRAGLAISSPYDGVRSLDEAAKLCKTMPKPGSWKVPTGSQDKKSDLMVLEADGALEAMPQLFDHWFWLASPKSPYYGAITFGQDGVEQMNYDYGRDDGTTSAVCVSKAFR